MPPRGLCQCGCGGVTRLARDTDRSRGTVKDEPLRYINGHGTKIHPSTRYEVDDVTGCWEWQGRVNAKGYGTCKDRGRPYLAHRWFWERDNGPVPDGLQLDHLCRNPRCVNPDHLEAVTGTENVRRGRACKLTAVAVREIRSRSRLPDESQEAFARRVAPEYGVTPGAIKTVLYRRVWAEVAPMPASGRSVDPYDPIEGDPAYRAPCPAELDYMASQRVGGLRERDEVRR